MSLKEKSDLPLKKDLISFEDLKKAAVIIRALNNQLRQRIIHFLLNDDTTTVTNIVLNLREDQTIISQHLNILRKAKIVTFLKKGKNVYYFINKTRLAEIQKSLEGLFDEIPIEDLKKIKKS